MGNYILLVALAAVVSIASLLHSSRSSALNAERRLAGHTYKSVVAREAAITGLNLTLRKLAADTTRWIDNPTAYGFTREPYRNATFTTAVLANYAPGPTRDRCIVDTVDVISTGVPDADATGRSSHLIHTTYVRSCKIAAGQTNDAESFNLGDVIDYNWGPYTNLWPEPEPEPESDPESEALNRAKGVRMLSYAEW